MADLELDLSPHPLVPQVAARLRDMEVPLALASELKTAAAAAASAKAVSEPEEAAAPEGGPRAIKAAKARDRLFARSLAESSGVPDLVTFVGYLGATVPKDKEAEPTPETDLRDKWSVLYLDSRLQNWLLVPAEGIVLRKKVKDEQAPFGRRDVLWVKADVAVGRGGGSLSVQAQFLTGEWTRAGDFDDGPQEGGTLAASTGVFCEARSVGCCRPRTPRTP